MKKLTVFLTTFVLVVIVFALFRAEIVEQAKTLSYQGLQLLERPLEAEKPDFRSEKYWLGQTFLLDSYLQDLGFVRIDFTEQTKWVYGRKVFTVWPSGQFEVNILGDELGALHDKNMVTAERQYQLRYTNQVSQLVDYNVVWRMVVAAANLREAETLNEMAAANRQDLEELFMKNSVS